ncbi:MAG: hypothetical protein EAX95_04195 [Candidatus Thorarchaeota archaeon]|nr:hypothetical protein [Candidatus Thorarchaeota archaeon]
MNWLAKIIKGKADEFSHAKLVKYGIGSHPGPRAKIAFSSNRITFKADLDYEKVFLRAYLLGAPKTSHKLKGLLRTYGDRTSEYATARMPLDWKVSKGKGASTYAAKLSEVPPLEDIQQLVELDDPTTFYLFSISPRDGSKPWSLTTKTSFPKGGPSDEEDEEKEKDPTFTKGALGNTPEVFDFIIQELLPDFADKVTPKTKKIAIYNTIDIDDIEIPDDPKMSFAEKRKQAKKRGRMQRRVVIDDKEYTGVASFFV